MRWVLPNPTPPYTNKGLSDFAGASATANDAACAKRLAAPTTKVSKVYLGFSIFAILFLGLIILEAELFSSILSTRSEEHTSELQSRFDLVCRLLLEKKKQTTDLVL